MQGQELRDEIARILKALRKAGYKNGYLVRHKYYSTYKCSNGQDALAWTIYNNEATVEELKKFLNEVPNDLLIDLYYDEDYGGTTLSFKSEVKIADEYWYIKLETFYSNLRYKQKQQEKELQLEPIRKKVLNKEELTEKELDFLFNK